MKLENEELEPCVICGKVWKRKETEHYVYHVSRGVVCQRHPGVMEWYYDLLEKASKELENV